MIERWQKTHITPVYHSCRPFYMVSHAMVTLVHHQHRLCQAQEHQNWAIEKWKKLVWSDESRFPLHHVDNQVCVEKRWQENSLWEEESAPNTSTSRNTCLIYPTPCIMLFTIHYSILLCGQLVCKEVWIYRWLCQTQYVIYMPVVSFFGINVKKK